MSKKKVIDKLHKERIKLKQVQKTIKDSIKILNKIEYADVILFEELMHAPFRITLLLEEVKKTIKIHGG